MMSLSSQIAQYADQVSTNANFISTHLGAKEAESTDVIAPELIAAKARLAEAAFALLSLSRDTGSFLVHLTVDVSEILNLRAPTFRPG